MKRKMHEKYRNPVKRLLAFGLSMVTAFTMMPAAMPAYTVQAADDQTAVETLAPTVENEKVTDAKILEYAGKEWYVIGSGSKGVQIAGSGENTLVLLARNNWGGNVIFINDFKNEYSGSVLQGKMDAYVTSENIGSYYTSGNNDPNDDWMDDLVAKRTLTGGGISDTHYKLEDKISGPLVEWATLWPLSAKEASQIKEDSEVLRGTGDWWLRSPGTYNGGAACVSSGVLNNSLVYSSLGVRPALRLNLTSDIFAVEKSGGVYELTNKKEDPASDKKSSESTDNNDEPTSEERRNLEYAKLHPYGQHTYVPSIVKDPTGETDGLMINVCRHCGYVERDSEQTISGYGVFNAKAVTAINNEAAGGTVQMETSRWISVHRKVLEALLAKPGTTLEVRYVYEGRNCVLSINGSDPRLALLLQTREDEYFGFPFLGTIFTVEEVK